MILKIISILCAIQISVAQNCQLNATLMDKKWIYATKPTNTSWDVLHTDYIKDQTVLYLICSSSSSSSSSSIQTNGRELFCNHGRFQEKNTSLLTPNCPQHIKADTVKLSNENSCRRQNGELYQVRYILPIGHVIPLYDVCYSQFKEQSLYSRHKTYGFDLTASTYRRPSFSRGTVVSREREQSFQPAHIYKTFVSLLGTKQTYVATNKTLLLERGHLANSQDFPTYDQMDATFKYINVMPQFRGNNRSNWKRIENWIHKLPSRNTYAEVVTGSFGILNLTHTETNQPVSIYLMSDNRNPIPLWLYKVVKYNGICYVFVTLNNDFNTNLEYNTSYCAVVTCPSGLQFTLASNSGISYCCNYNYFVRYIGRHAVLC